ncbi:P-loop containing nucleoside triphosphate hydrolase protein [Calycina marina]|uniref:P-loop containing nucleoside triphosphate hydrolase protein n=1 Tax=Calycina marina TaxID=1763456 RepID=A0A9P8CHH6_9HELO|nr:P-loop containing nucleoside triphosphate hydrolase protein [Calycina marina]
MSSADQEVLRTKRLSKALHQFLRGDRTIQGAADAKLFLEALQTEVNPSRCIETIISSKAKLEPIRAFTHSLKLIKHISDPAVKSLANGSFLNDLLLSIIHPTTFWNAVVKLCLSNGLSEENLQHFLWLSMYLYIKAILAAENHVTRTYWYKTEKLLLAIPSKDPRKSAFGAGERHDNDFADFRQICIYPTADEFLCKEQPYSVRAKEVQETTEKERTMIHLDNQFRLLREDMLGERGRGSGISLDEPCLALHCETGLEKITRLGAAGRKKFLSESKGFLKHQSFGALVGENEIYGFARVINRKNDFLLQEQPIVHLQFPNDASFKRAVTNEEGKLQPAPSLKYEAGRILAKKSADGSIVLRNMHSVVNALTKPVSVIRGPPGSGKSFLGSFLVKTILRQTDLKVLVISFKNHALDDCMEKLLDLGVEADVMVRLGSRAKSTARTEQLLLDRRQHTQSRETWNVINQIQPRVKEVSEEMQKSFLRFGNFSVSWKDIQEYLETGGWNCVSKKDRKVQEDYLFKQWKAGNDAGVFAGSAAKAFPQLYKEYSTAQEQLTDLRNERKIDTLRQIKLIRGANPDIVLVEEAGGILETHILTALTPSVKQLILIGDDKQLRPKANALSVENGNGFDFNRSLFERLILNGHEHTTLRKQRRMHPEISIHVRELMYPDIVDGPKTTERDRPSGVHDRVVFVNHTRPEMEFTDILDRRDPEQTNSKQNQFEATMILRIVKYLSQQGYGSERLVVLTPYLGRLRLLRQCLSEANDPWLNDLDTFELLRAGLMTQAAANIKKSPLRLSTIDNYLGEESDFVIVSLTRSNSRGDIGLMAALERLNVLLSRARCGLIMIGNEETFMASKKGGKMWTNFFKSLQAKGCLHDGLPVRCEKRPKRTFLLRESRDFDRCCPNGGCSEPCGKLLKYKTHICRSRCHRVDDHTKVECTQVVERICDRNRYKTKFPCNKANEACAICVEIQRDLERRAQYAAELQQVQDEIEHHKRTEKIIEDGEQAKKQLDQRKNELAELKTSDKAEVAEQAREMERQQQKRKAQKQKQAEASSQFKVPNQLWNASQTGAAGGAPLDELMDMIGLEEVKQEFPSIKSRVDTAVRQRVSLKNERFGCSLLGNPGTGKTTVARLYAKLLTSVGVVAGNIFKETTGAALANNGVSGCQKLLDDDLNQGGGVIFIDEAYELTSGNSAGGKTVLDFLLPEVENTTGKCCIRPVLAGYDKEMESFFSHNLGLPSRFTNDLKFADYTDDELLRILEGKINSEYDEMMEVEGGIRGLYCRVITRRIGRGRGRPGFGNAQTIETTLAIICRRQANRLRKETAALAPSDPKPNVLLFTKEDVIGPVPSEALKGSKAWEELSELTGLKTVKEAVRSLCDTIEENYSRELAEQATIQYSLNRVFLGNPGTGKTTVGKIYAKVLSDLGLLSKGDVVPKNSSDFVGSALGKSEQQTKGILAAAEGKVLIIDEASGLYGGGGVSDPYKTAVIDNIVAEVQGVPGDDRCKMFQNVNSGLSSRFPLASAFQFDDIDDAELSQILDLKLKQSLKITDQAKTVVLDMLNRARNRSDFGNAREIDNLLGRAKEWHQTRRTKKLSKYANTFEAKDFDEDFDRANQSDTNVKALFQGTVGQEAIMALLEGYQQTVQMTKSLGMDPKENIPFNFLFRGPPVFYDMGFLATAELIECSATDLVGQYVGQTSPKVQQLLEKALGKVLFIDEAYCLREGHFAKEAMDELNDINNLMSTNPGLTSRFREVIDFRGLKLEECFTLLTSTLAAQKKILMAKKVTMEISSLETPSTEFKNIMLAHFGCLAHLDNWASARDVETLSKSIFSQAIKAIEHIKRGELPISEKLIDSVCSAMVRERKSRGNTKVVQNLPAGFRSLLEPQPQTSQRPTTTSITTATSTQATTDPEPDPKEPENENPPSLEIRTADKPIYPTPQRDAGVIDEVWEQLQRYQEAAIQEEEEYRALLKVRDDADDAERDHIVKRLIEEEARRKKEAELKKKLAIMGKCPVGFEWIKQDCGWRCAGGSHYISNNLIQLIMKDCDRNFSSAWEGFVSERELRNTTDGQSTYISG